MGKHHASGTKKLHKHESCKREEHDEHRCDEMNIVPLALIVSRLTSPKDANDDAHSTRLARKRVTQMPELLVETG